MTEIKNNKYPQGYSKGDMIHSLAKTAAGLFKASELINYLITPPLEKRRAEWFEDLGCRLKELEDKQFILLEDLKYNDEFIDITLQATQVALRSSQIEKKEALKNAILNNACQKAPELSFQQMFINYIESFTEWHIKILYLFSNPPRWAKKNNFSFKNMHTGILSIVLEQAFPELSNKEDFYNQIWKDLYLKGLINTEDLHVTMTSAGLMSKRATKIGVEFVNYINCECV